MPPHSTHNPACPRLAGIKSSALKNWIWWLTISGQLTQQIKTNVTIQLILVLSGRRAKKPIHDGSQKNELNGYISFNLLRQLTRYSQPLLPHALLHQRNNTWQKAKT
jgi:hypothetical protein